MLFVGVSTPGVAQDELPDKASPFTAVQWTGDSPLVRYEGDWYEFVSLDGLSADEILAFAQEEYGDLWQKRFSEDLVELLGGMGHTPAVEVELVLRREGETVTRTGAMTEDNRQQVWAYNHAPSEEASATGQAADPGSASGVAAQFAEHIDRVWDEAPDDGTAHLRFLLYRGSTPFAMPPSLETDFAFRATGARGLQIHQGFNPNSNGRWVYENLDPGTYEVTLEGAEGTSYEDWTWTRTVTVEAGEAPLFEVSL